MIKIFIIGEKWRSASLLSFETELNIRNYKTEEIIARKNQHNFFFHLFYSEAVFSQLSIFMVVVKLKGP